MNRRLLSAAFGATMIAAAVIPATTLARTPQSTQAATRVAVPQIDHRLHAGMLADKVGNVMLELSALPVVVRSGERSRRRQAAHGGAGSVGPTGAQVDPERAAPEHRRRRRKGPRPVPGRLQRHQGPGEPAAGRQARHAARRQGRPRDPDRLARQHRRRAIHRRPATWGATGFTGNGVKIAIIDTGLDYYHADFGGSGDPADYTAADPTTLADGGFPTTKVAGGYDFAGDGYDATGDNGSTTPAPDPDPLDCGPADHGDGHGTHVAGTAAGQGVLADGSTYTGPYNASTISGHSWKVGPGVAPRATLYSFKVFGCQGSTDLTVDAINAAVAAHVDVINMSLGSPLGEPSPDDPRPWPATTRSRPASSSSPRPATPAPTPMSTARRPRRPGSSRPRRSTRCRPSRRRSSRSRRATSRAST